MKRLSLTLALLFLAAAPQAEIDRAVAASAGMQAKFTQQFTPKGFTKPQTESGTVVFGKLPEMRWTYTQPESKTFVFDGKQSWFYVPADKQVTVTTITVQHKRDLPFLLLGDPAARAESFNVTERGDVTTLVPKDRAALIRQVEFATDPSTHRITSISYADRDGNRTQFRFSDYKPAPAAADAFSFTPPAGVQVVRGD